MTSLKLKSSMLYSLRQHLRYHRRLLPGLLKVFVPITIALYVLRGFAILSFMPGGIILLMIILSLLTGIIYGLEKTGGI